MSKWKEYGIPCPCGVSSDSYAIDKEGNGYCFRGDCKKFFNNTEVRTISSDDKVHFEFYPQRGISKKTLEFYNIKTKFVNDVPYETGFFYPNENGFKFRRHGDNVPKNQRYYTTDGLYSPGLWGKDKFDPGSKESITICEGMYDAPAMFEILHGNSACVCVTSSANAKRDISKDFEYVNSFKKIYLCFDNDEAGRNATAQIVPLFDFNKVYHVKFHKHKDPTEYLEQGNAEELREAWKNARRFAPENIINTFAEVEKALEDGNDEMVATWPFKCLNDKLYGIFAGEVTVIKAPEGVGKTTFFGATEHHILKTTNVNIAIIHLEEKNSRSIKRLAGYELGVDAIKPDNNLTNKDVLDAYRKMVGDNEDRVHIYSSWDVQDEDNFLANIRFMVVSGGVKIVCLDHITWLGTGLDSDDERKKLDRLTQKLKLMAEELGFALIEISAINDDGKTRGSRNISKAADNVIMLTRDTTAFDPIVRNTIDFVIEKSRLGESGPGGSAIKDMITGRLIDKEEQVN